MATCCIDRVKFGMEESVDSSMPNLTPSVQDMDVSSKN